MEHQIVYKGFEESSPGARTGVPDRIVARIADNIARWKPGRVAARIEGRIAVCTERTKRIGCIAVLGFDSMGCPVEITVA